MKRVLKRLSLILTLSLVCTLALHWHVYKRYNKAVSARYELGEILLEARKKLTGEAAEVFGEHLAPNRVIESMGIPPYLMMKSTDDDDAGDVEDSEKECKINPADIRGRLKVLSTYQPREEDAIRSAGSDVINGCYRPRGCKSRQKVAIVIPYKSRYKHLLALTNHIHPILQRQKLFYCVFVAEQYDDGMFNKAQVMNAAFLEITKNWNNNTDPHSRMFDCFLFHDVDMLAEDDRNIYSCASSPKHLSPAIDKFNYSSFYGTIYGGVTAIRTEQYKLVNGHSNRFWGWGGEDNDMETRIAANGLNITVANPNIGRYKMITHDHPWWFHPESGLGSADRVFRKKRNRDLGKNNKDEKVEKDRSGLSDIKYNLIGSEKRKLWTKLTLDIRSQVIEKQIIRFVDLNVPEIEVFYSDQDVETGKKDEDRSERERECINPDYYKFNDMTINRTASLTDQRYSNIYQTLEKAKRECNIMMSQCKAIIELIKGRYLLRSTAFVQENNLTYKYEYYLLLFKKRTNDDPVFNDWLKGLAEQYHVNEVHHTVAVYVKLCPGNPSYTQFITEPIIMEGNSTIGPPLFYQMETYLRFFHHSNDAYTLHSHVMTSHKAVMDEMKLKKTIRVQWWDTLSRMHYGRYKFINMTRDDLIAMHTVEENKNSRLLRIRSLKVKINRLPGCYVVKCRIVNDLNDITVASWTWWFRLRALNSDIENKLLEMELERSLEAGRQFVVVIEAQNKKMEEQKGIEKEQKREED